MKKLQNQSKSRRSSTTLLLVLMKFWTIWATFEKARKFLKTTQFPNFSRAIGVKYQLLIAQTKIQISSLLLSFLYTQRFSSKIQLKKKKLMIKLTTTNFRHLRKVENKYEITRFNSFLRSSLRQASVGFITLPPFVVFILQIEKLKNSLLLYIYMSPQRKAKKKF